MQTPDKNLEKLFNRTIFKTTEIYMKTIKKMKLNITEILSLCKYEEKIFQIYSKMKIRLILSICHQFLKHSTGIRYLEVTIQVSQNS